MKIPFNKPYHSGQELNYINDALTRNHISGDGYYTKLVQGFIEKRFCAGKTLLTTSCTHALDMAALLIDLQAGDEVILPSYTFVSTVNAVMLRGAKPVFAEIDPKTLNIDTADIEKKITNQTKAIFPVHYAGVGCQMDKIMEIADKFNLFVVEDAAQGVNARFKGKYLGTIGHIGCYSFHETKNITSGEGGAIVINSSNRELSERAEIIREKGTNRSKFFRGEVDKYTWVDIGSSYLPSDILAAYLYAQFEQMENIQEKRKNIFQQYHESLKEYQKLGLIKLPYIPKDRICNYHMFYIILPNERERDRVMQRLKDKGIHAVFHYLPLHTSPMGRKLGYRKGDLPITEMLSSCLLRLPMYAGMTAKEQEYVISNLLAILDEIEVIIDENVNSHTAAAMDKTLARKE